MDGPGEVVASRPAPRRRCTSGGRDGAAMASWCNGTRATMTGWRAEANRSI